MDPKQYIKKRFAPTQPMENFREALNTNFGKEAIAFIGTVSTGSPTIGGALAKKVAEIVANKKENGIASMQENVDSLKKKADALDKILASLKNKGSQEMASLDKNEPFQSPEKQNDAHSMQPKF